MWFLSIQHKIIRNAFLPTQRYWNFVTNLITFQYAILGKYLNPWKIFKTCIIEIVLQRITEIELIWTPYFLVFLNNIMKLNCYYKFYKLNIPILVKFPRNFHSMKIPVNVTPLGNRNSSWGRNFLAEETVGGKWTQNLRHFRRQESILGPHAYRF